MANDEPKRRVRASVPVDGTAIRELRIDRGMEIATLAKRARITPAYVTKLELGHSLRCSPTVYAALVRILRPDHSRDLRSDNGTRQAVA